MEDVIEYHKMMLDFDPIPGEVLGGLFGSLHHARYLR